MGVLSLGGDGFQGFLSIKLATYTARRRGKVVKFQLV